MTPTATHEMEEVTMPAPKKKTAPGSPAPVDVNKARAKLLDIRSEMKQVLIERDPEIDLVLLSVIAQQHGVFVGEGGVAKSMTIDTFMERVDLPVPPFKVMLRKSMPVEEIFGQLSLKGLENDQFLYITKNRLAETYVAFIDEIFKGNPVVLNAMLMAINERIFINDGMPVKIPLWSVFGASNELPNEAELAAFRDRFAWCKEVKPVSTDDNFKAVLRGAINRSLGQGVPVTKIQQAEVEALQAEVLKVDVNGVLDQIATMKRRAEGEFSLYISARRYISGIRMCQAQAAINGRSAVIEDDLTLFQHTLWTDIEDAPKAYEVTLDYAGKVARVTQQLRQAYEPYKNDLAALKGEIPADGKISQEVAGRTAMIQMNLKQTGTHVTKQIEEARVDGRDVGELESLLAEIDQDRRYIREEILG